MNTSPRSNGHPDRAHASSPVTVRRPPLVPPHIAWPLFIVLLLLMSVSAAVVTFVAAHSDGGAQVIEGSPYDTGR